ncbi:MAG: DUF3048 domain-containing protein [Lachnospiraceae bacterium]|nr:DUF3048 domain-containing protein [Candidatus Equihabitans merdae]
MKKRFRLPIAVALSAVMMLSGCTLGHKADTTQEESVVESVVSEVEEPESVVESVPESEPESVPEAEPEVVETEPIPEGMVKSTITGEYVTPEVGQTRAVSFMIDNSKAADPQSGLSRAKIIYEAPVEGSYTRMCATFEEFSDLPRIGPLRSCRDYFLSLTAGLDRLFVHYGQAAYALPYLESDDVDNLSGLLGSTYGCFYRDSTFHTGEHSAYIGYEGVQKAIDIRGYRRTYNEDHQPMYKFAWVGDEITNEGGQDAAYVEPGYFYNTPTFTYNPDDKHYYRNQFGRAHVDAENGQQLWTDNIILEYQNYDIYQRLTIDHPVYLHFDTTAGGRGKYITRGKAIDIRWERPSFWEPVKYYDMDGNELTINTGITWVLLIQNEFLGKCLIGADQASATCIENEEFVANAEQYNADWKAAYENNEPNYLHIMAEERDQAVASHGGQSKVEG